MNAVVGLLLSAAAVCTVWWWRADRNLDRQPTPVSRPEEQELRIDPRTEFHIQAARPRPLRNHYLINRALDEHLRQERSTR